MFDTTETYLRLRDIVRNPKTGELNLLPVSRGTWLHLVATGQAPEPIRFSPGVNLWRKSDVVKFVESRAGIAAT